MQIVMRMMIGYDFIAEKAATHPRAVIPS